VTAIATTTMTATAMATRILYIRSTYTQTYTKACTVFMYFYVSTLTGDGAKLTGSRVMCHSNCTNQPRAFPSARIVFSWHKGRLSNSRFTIQFKIVFKEFKESYSLESDTSKYTVKKFVLNLTHFTCPKRSAQIIMLIWHKMNS